MVESGGKVTGSIQVNRGGLSFGTGGILDFDITTLDNNSGVLVTNYSLISGTPDCTLTVSDSQSNGTYMLATSASGFDRTITVKSAAGTTLGTLTVDGTLEYNGRSYTLALSGTLLTVTVDNSIFTGDLIDETKDITLGLRASSVNILSSGVLNVYARGTAEVTTLNSRGVFNVYEGGTARDTVVNSCGSMYVGNGGNVVNTVVHDTGEFHVLTGGIAVSTTIAADGGHMMVVSRGGSAIDTVAEYTMGVYDGASVSNTTLKNRGYMLLYGSSFDTIISSGGEVEIPEYISGAFASATTILDGGLFSVSGGSALDVTMSGGSMNVSSSLVSGFYMYGGSATVKGQVSGGAISGGTMEVGSFAMAEDLLVSGGEVSMAEHGYFNGTITGTGVVRIGSSVEVYNTTVRAGGRIAGSIQVNRGGLTFGEGGVLNFDISDIGPGNETLVTNYSLIGGTPECTLTISTDAQADGTYYLASGAADFEQTITIANAYGDVYGTLSVGGESVLVGSQDYMLNLDDDGLLSVEVTGGGSEIITGDITGETVDVLDGMYASSVNLNSDGILNVYAGGSADITTVNSSGRLNLRGGNAYQVTVNDGGAMIIEEGLAENVETDGYLCVSAAGSIIGFTMCGGDADVIGTLEGGSIEDGTMRIYNPGMVTGLTVSSGTVIVDAGARFNGMILEGGVVRVGAASELSGVTVSSGGKVTGSINLNSEFVSISFLAGSILDFNISRLAPENDALVTNYSFLDGMPEFTLTVTDSQGNGTYNLATGVESFGWNISVMNTSDTLLGLLMIGRTVTIGGTDYTLNLGDDGLLSVTVGPYTPPGPEPPTPTSDWIFFNGDYNGDGFDMLAVETPEQAGAQPASVTIYQNGEPWGLGVALDYGWEVVGSGDFNGDGLDDFLRVNEEGYVVGEMSNGNGTFSPQVLNFRNPGWEILGTGDFNGNGTDDILIANPTGASETVGLLGYWESGATWTLINGYSAEWECVATGDFNGDGKCDMLWRNQFEGEGGGYYNAYCTWIVEDPVDWRMVSVANPQEWNFLCSGDFDGDKMNDIAMINGDGVVGIWGVSDGWLSSWSILSAVTPEWQLAGVADFNADGTDDIAWANTDTGLVGYWQIENKELASWANIATLS